MATEQIKVKGITTGVATNIFTDEEGTHCVYRGTKVVSFTNDTVTLRSGGWETITTKKRMNTMARAFNLPFSVFQKKGDWFVDTNAGRVPFGDGMTIDRHAGAVFEYRVIVGNIGTVYDGYSKTEAFRAYDRYCNFSMSDCGRASGEDVTLFENGEPIREHIGTNHDQEEG